MTDSDERLHAIGDHLERVAQDYLRYIRKSGGKLPTDADISVRELEIVRELQRRGTRRMHDLSEHVGAAVSTMTGVVDRMIARGWLARERSEEDRRVVNVLLTPSGEELCAALDEHRQRFFQFLFGGLEETDQRTFLQLLEKVAGRSRSADGPPA